MSDSIKIELTKEQAQAMVRLNFLAEFIAEDFLEEVENGAILAETAQVVFQQLAEQMGTEDIVKTPEKFLVEEHVETEMDPILEAYERDIIQDYKLGNFGELHS